MDTPINFEEWATLLLKRKVPQDFLHLIDSEVIHSGADILKRGDAFEVHLETPALEETNNVAHLISARRVFVTPMSDAVRVQAS